jgi:hypothetical protein
MYADDNQNVDSCSGSFHHMHILARNISYLAPGPARRRRSRLEMPRSLWQPQMDAAAAQSRARHGLRLAVCQHQSLDMRMTAYRYRRVDGALPGES